MSTEDEFARDQLIRKFTGLSEGISQAKPPEGCGLGEKMQALGVLICESQIFMLEHVEPAPSKASPSTIIMAVATKCPWAATAAFIAWVYAKSNGLL